MAYRLRQKETVADGLRRLIRGQTAAAVSLLADGGNDVANRVHEARRALKRLRALLHLARPSLPQLLFAEENRRLRDASRRLAAARDAVVTLQTLESLAGALPKEEWAPLLQQFREKAERSKRRTTHAKLGRIASIVRKSGLAIASARFKDEGWNLVKPGLDCALCAARKKQPAMRGEPDPAALHEWRKHLKRLLHQLEIFKPFLKKPERSLVKTLTQLASLLGEHHDHLVLERILQKSAKVLGPGKPSAEMLLRESTRRQKALLRKVRKSSAPPFLRKTKKVLGRVHEAWKARRKRST